MEAEMEILAVLIAFIALAAAAAAKGVDSRFVDGDEPRRSL